MPPILRHIIILVAAILLPRVPAEASPDVFYTDPYEGYNEETFLDMDFEPNLVTPPVPDAERPIVRRLVAEAVKSIEGRGPYAIDLMREGEVMIVTIPTDNIFLPNDTLLTASADRAFAPLFPLMQEWARWKIVLALHTDDTGNELYQDRLATARLHSVYDFFLDMIDEDKINGDICIIPFPIGADDPLVENDTWRHRAENRRLEIFFVPGASMIEQAHKEVEAGNKKK